MVVRINDITGVRTIRVLLRDRITIFTDGDRASRFVNVPLLAAVNIDDIAEVFFLFIRRGRGCGRGGCGSCRSGSRLAKRRSSRKL